MRSLAPTQSPLSDPLTSPTANILVALAFAGLAGFAIYNQKDRIRSLVGEVRKGVSGLSSWVNILENKISN